MKLNFNCNIINNIIYYNKQASINIFLYTNIFVFILASKIDALKVSREYINTLYVYTEIETPSEGRL